MLFDFDLTLADSSAGAVECVNHALRAVDQPAADPERIRRTIGLSLPDGFEQLTGITTPALVQEYSRRFVERADEVMVELTRLYAGVPEVVSSLRARGVRLAIVSTKFRRRIEAVLERDGLAGSFDVIVGGEDTSRHKPDPEGLLLALERLGTPVPASVYVGDHPVDARAAAAAEIAFVAALTGTSGREAFDALGARAFVSDLSELLGVLARGELSRSHGE